MFSLLGFSCYRQTRCLQDLQQDLQVQSVIWFDILSIVLQFYIMLHIMKRDNSKTHACWATCCINQNPSVTYMFLYSTVSGFTEYSCTIYCLVLIKFVVRIKILCFSVYTFSNKNHKRLMSLLCISDLYTGSSCLKLVSLCLS